MPLSHASLRKLSAEQILTLARQQVQEMADRHHLEIGSPQEESKLVQKSFMYLVSFISYSLQGKRGRTSRKGASPVPIVGGHWPPQPTLIDIGKTIVAIAREKRRSNLLLPAGEMMLKLMVTLS